MTRGHSDVLSQIETLFNSGSSAGVSDRQLLERFIARRDDVAEAAFAALVARHGSMVLKVCRGILRDTHASQDAFQATFLLLATKAPRIDNGELLANWLYGVALRTAMKARSQAARRRRHENRAAGRLRDTSEPPADDLELHRFLHEGINALPEKYRLPVVLCYLEGLSREQAAALLRCPASTVGVRLMRARERLRLWLSRRHRDSDASLILAGLDSRSYLPAVPTALAQATTDAAILISAGKLSFPAAASASIAALIKEVQMSLIMSKLNLAGTSLLACGVILASIVVLIQPQSAANPPRSDEQEILDLERAWGTALVNRDAALLDRIVAYEMFGTDPGGHLWDKAAYLEAVKSGAFKIESFELAETRVRVYGDAAVSTGISITNKQSRSGLGRGAARFTDVYVRRNGCWQCVAWQSLGIPDRRVAQTSPPSAALKPAASTDTAMPRGSQELAPVNPRDTVPGTSNPATSQQVSGTEKSPTPDAAQKPAGEPRNPFELSDPSSTGKPPASSPRETDTPFPDPNDLQPRTSESHNPPSRDSS